MYYLIVFLLLLAAEVGYFENRRTFTSIDNLYYVINRLIHNDVHSGICHMADD